MSLVHHHKSVRKRISKKLAPFPHPIRWKRHLDRSVAILGVGNFFATLPQVYVIWESQDAGSVSPISWGYYTLFASVLLTYGVVHREKPIIITYACSTIVHAVVTIGAIIY